MPNRTFGWRAGTRRYIDHVTRAQRIVLSACAACLGVVLTWMLLSAPSALASACVAQDNFTGPANGFWSTAGNWSKAALPKSTETVCIPEGEGTITVPEKFKAEAKTVLAQSGVKIEDQGTLAVAETTGGAGTASTFTGLSIEAGGLLTNAGSWFLLSGNNVVNGDITTTNFGSAFIELQSGIFSGTGKVKVAFANAGTVEPGAAGIVGKLGFTNFAQRAGGTIALDLKSATEFDQLGPGGAVGEGSYYIIGTIDVNLLGGYMPAPEAQWEFLTGISGDTIETPLTFSPANYEAIQEPFEAFLKLKPLPPVSVTEPASSVLQASAVLNGTVNPNGSHVSSCEFDYGTTISYGLTAGCSAIAGSGSSPVAVDAGIAGLSAATTYHFKLVAKTANGPSEGLDRTFTTPASSTEGTKGSSTEKESTGASSTKGTASTTTAAGTTSLVSSITSGGSTTTAVATTPKAVEELLLGCTKRSLVLNDVLVRGGRVALEGSAAKSLLGKKVKIIFDGGKQVATATVQANGQFSSTAPLPAARLRESNSARYLAESGSQRSLNLKLTRRLSLEPPKFSGASVTLSGQVVPPLTKPIAKVTVEQQLECGKTSKVLTFTPPASGRFHVTINGIPANAKAGIYRLTSSVTEKPGAKHGFATFSLPLPVALG